MQKEKKKKKKRFTGYDFLLHGFHVKCSIV